jgi:hypothetical protein
MKIVAIIDGPSNRTADLFSGSRCFETNLGGNLNPWDLGTSGRATNRPLVQVMGRFTLEAPRNHGV